MAAGALRRRISSTAYCSVTRVSSTSSTISTRLPRTNAPKVSGSSVNHCLRSTVSFAVFVASSYSSSDIARIGFFTSVRSMRAGMKPPPPMATKTSGANASTSGAQLLTAVAICA